MNAPAPAPPLHGTIELKPCPFCGRAGRLFRDRFGQFAADCSGSIRHKDCFFSRINGGGLSKFETAAQAADAWNKRGEAASVSSYDPADCPIKEEDHAVL